MGNHALLSASSSHRWINCPPSARLCECYEDTTSDYAAEGTDAHALCEFKLKTALGMNPENPIDKLSHYSDEMEECANGYVTYILELLEAAKQKCSDPLLLIEQRLDFSKYVKDGFGTGDCVIIADGTLNIIDYKHGQGVLVEAEDNPQMKLYAIGVCETFDGIYNISDASMTIYQPRRNNISVYNVFKEELYDWAEEILKPKAELAFSGNGNYQCGEWCRFCKAKYECRERSNYNMQLASYDFKLPPLLEDDEIEQILGKIDQLTSWASDIKNYALQTAIGGKRWNNWKLVESRSNRKYTDETKVEKALKLAGYSDIYNKKLIKLSAMERLLGEEKFKEILGKFIEKPKGHPTLVPITDKRLELKNLNNIMEDFS